RSGAPAQGEAQLEAARLVDAVVPVDAQPLGVAVAIVQIAGHEVEEERPVLPGAAEGEGVPVRVVEEGSDRLAGLGSVVVGVAAADGPGVAHQVLGADAPLPGVPVVLGQVYVA